MLRNRPKIRTLAAVLAAVILLNALAPSVDSIEQLTNTITSCAAGETGTVNTDRLNIRSGPGTEYDKVTSLTAGTTVTITSETTGSDGYIWYGVTYSGGSGYARYDYISIAQTYSIQDSAFETYMTQQGFPDSYKNGLRGLHEKYPNWIFTAQQTGLDWETVVSEESKIGKNLVDTNSISSWKSLQTGAFDWASNYWPGFDGDSWVQASTELVAYYLDPRNFLVDPYIFQFELQEYDSSVQTRDGLMSLIADTFLDDDAVVPVEGSVISGGTVIEGSTYTRGTSYTSSYMSTSSSGSTSSSSSDSSSSSSSSSSSTAAGPGAGTSSNVIIGPGVTIDSSSSTSGTSSSGPYTIISAIDRLTGVLTSFAGYWQQSADSWYYIDDDGSSLAGGWYWLDGNSDGISECYYFYENGTMASSTTVEGYTVDSDGRWTVDGVVQIRSSVSSQTSSTSSSGPSSTASSSSSGQTVYGPGSTVSTSADSDSSGSTVSTDSSSSDSSGTVSGELKKVPYVDIIMYAASASGVSPYVLAATILQEQGYGTSDLISGSYSSYPGYYNYFNVNAYAQDGMTATQAGLKYAYEQGWSSIEISIIEGAKEYGSNYVSAGQDTYYLKKFNVQGDNLYNHQYMTHVLAAASEGSKVSAAYSSSFKATALEFKIPVYNNMPDTACSLPTGDGNPNNKLKALSVDGYTITPTFSMDTTEYSLIVDGGVSSVTISATVIDSGASVSGSGTVSLGVGLNQLSVVVTAENGSQRTYSIGITRKDDGSTSSDTVTTSNSSEAVANGPSSAIISDTDTDSSTVTVGSSTGSYGPGSMISYDTSSGTTTTDSSDGGSSSSSTSDSGTSSAGPGGTSSSGSASEVTIVIGEAPQ